MNVYNKYSDYLKNKYGEKVYKLTIGLPLTCPNRDGNVSTGGCTFCGDDGAGHEVKDRNATVKEQLLLNKEHISKKYKAKKFIAYYQNYSNTYMSIEDFKNYINQGLIEDIVEISVSTRPDCLMEEHLEYLKSVKDSKNINITIELGLQTTNYHTLEKINRGHSLAEFVDSVLRTKKYDFEVCVHLIPNLPYDNMTDVIEMAKMMSVLKVDFVKLHALFLVNGTKMSEEVEKGEIELLSLEDYKERVKVFLSYLSPDIYIQRIIGRAPKLETSFVNWSTSWWKIRDDIEAEMLRDNIYQGKYFNYTNGYATKNKFNN